uniref:Interleukin-1 beta n=1 Tax=Seriola lalandi dorsalis TaxID=1841481 RepID=A0A3B4WR00_SERLL
MESEMKCNLSEMWSSKMPKGLDLEISHHPMTMRRVANLIIAMERLKAGTSESVLSTEFRDENLLNIMMENMVEAGNPSKQMVTPVIWAPTHSPAQVFSLIWPISSSHQCSVTDSQQRHLVRDLNSMELNAVTLQAGSENHKVHLTMSTYLPPLPSTEAKARPVALCIKDTNIYLSCHMDGDMPTLNLE